MPAGAAPALDWVFLMGYGPPPARMTLEFSARELENCLDWCVPPAKMVLGMPIYGSNGPATIEKKTRHAVGKGAGGVGWWYIGLDCHDGRSVMKAAAEALRNPAAQP